MPLRITIGVSLLAFLFLVTPAEKIRAQSGGVDPRNPDGMFNWYAQVQWANDELYLEKILGRMDPELVDRLKVYVVRAGITNGKMTRAQFVDFWNREAVPIFEARRKQLRDKAAAEAAGTLNLNAPREKTAEKEKEKPKPTYQPRPFREDESRNIFKQLDRDQSNDLDVSEYRQHNIRREIDRWDTNGNKLIELDEFLAFQRDRHNERENDRKAEEEEREEERKLMEEFRAFKKSKMPGAPPPGPILPDRPAGPRATTSPDTLPL